MGRFTSMVVLFLLALVSTTSSAKPIDCMAAISNIFPCFNFLKNPNNAQPESSCCNAAKNWKGLGDVDTLCKCLQPIVSQFLPHKPQQLPGLCNLDLAAYLPLLKCLAPLFALPPLPFGPLPPLPPLPLIPLPPLPPFPFVPLPPLPPLPLVPLPPLPPFPFVPLPPLPFLPPAENQEKDSQDAEA